MHPEEIFSLALGINLPWQVVSVAFSNELKRLDSNIDFKRGAVFPCPVCGDLVPAYDTIEKTWRHMYFFQHEVYLTARTSRVNCPKNGCELSWFQSLGQELAKVLY